MRRANKAVMDANGFVTGIVTRSEEGFGQQQKQVAKDSYDESVYERHEFFIDVEGTLRPITMKVYVGTTFNDVPVKTKGRGKTTTTVYNRLITLCLSLGLLTEKELKNTSASDELMERVQTDLGNMLGDTVRFRVTNEGGYFVPDIRTIKKVPADA